MRPRIPLSAFEREKLRTANRWAGGILLLGLATAALAARSGSTRVGVLSLAMAAAYGAGIVSIRLRIPWLTAVLLSLAPLAGGFLLGYPFLGALAAAGFFAWLALASSRIRLDPESVRPLESTAVDPEAAGHVAAFEELGFEQVGALSFEPTPGQTVIETVMIGPRGDQYAAVTDLVLDVVSTFGERLLVTRNSASGSLLPECLANDLRGADPPELVAAHRRGLELLAARGLRPDPISPERLLEWQLGFERRSIEWAFAGFGRRLVQTFVRSGAGVGQLDASPASRRRIDGWQGLRSS